MICASFGGGKSTGVFNVYELNVASQNIPVPAAIALQAVKVPVICAPLMRPRVLPDDLPDPVKCLQLAADCTSSEPTLHIDIVVGQDQYWSFVKSGLVHTSEGLVAMETVFGWVLSGPVRGAGRAQGSGMDMRQLLTMVAVSARHIWGASDPSEIDETPDSALSEFNSSIRYDDGRYVVQIPWKHDMKSQLMDNYESAKQRLVSLDRKLAKSPDLQKGYDAALVQMEEEGVIHEVPSDQVKNSEVTYYMPHRPVVKPDSASTKIRPVFDASAGGPNGVSLTDVVEVGPPLMPSLPDVRLRFS